MPGLLVNDDDNEEVFVVVVLDCFSSSMPTVGAMDDSEVGCGQSSYLLLFLLPNAKSAVDVDVESDGLILLKLSPRWAMLSWFLLKSNRFDDDNAGG